MVLPSWRSFVFALKIFFLPQKNQFQLQQIPCITIAVVNVCTFRPRTPVEKTSQWRFSHSSSNLELKKRGNLEAGKQVGSIPVVHKKKKLASSTSLTTKKERPRTTGPGPRQDPTIESKQEEESPKKEKPHHKKHQKPKPASTSTEIKLQGTKESSETVPSVVPSS